MRRRIHKALWLLTSLALFGLSPRISAETIHVGVLTHDSLTSTVRTLHGIKKSIRQKYPDVVYHSFLVEDESSRHQTIIDSLNQLKPRLVLTVGSAATAFARDNLPEIPIVFSSVMYPALSGFVTSMAEPGANITGASLNIPVDIQFKYFKEILPDLKKIGVLYTSNTAALIPQARLVARQAGLTLEAFEVNSYKDIPGALDSLAKEVDGMWAVADANLWDPRSTKYIIMNATRKGLPFMGFSRHVVESGALFALDFDYKGIGMQAGAIAARILDGEAPGRIAVTMANRIWFHYNERTAQHIGVTIPEHLVAVAKEVYR